MNKSLFGGAVILVGAFSLMAFSGSGTLEKLTGAAFLDTYKTTEDATLVDVRTPAEFQAGHIEGAINIDFENPNFMTEFKKLDPSKPYFLYCRSGNRSGQAVTMLSQAGFTNLYDLQGGVVSNRALPLVTTQ